jgi:hypothetical protein
MYTQNTINLNVKWEVSASNQFESNVYLDFEHSEHSYKRACQRGMQQNVIADTIQFGEAYFKQGMIFYVLGDRQQKSLRTDKSKNTVVIVAGDSNMIITCYRSSNPFKHLKKKQKRLS